MSVCLSLFPCLSLSVHVCLSLSMSASLSMSGSLSFLGVAVSSVYCWCVLVHVCLSVCVVWERGKRGGKGERGVVFGVCTVVCEARSKPLCVDSKRRRVCRQNAHERFSGTDGDVLNPHTEAFLNLHAHTNTDKHEQDTNNTPHQPHSFSALRSFFLSSLSQLSFSFLWLSPICSKFSFLYSLTMFTRSVGSHSVHAKV